MHISYHTSELVCSRKIELDVTDGIIHNVVFTGGCPGNLAAIAKLVEGQKAVDIIRLLRGNRCGENPTSCADQLAIALEQTIA